MEQRFEARPFSTPARVIDVGTPEPTSIGVGDHVTLFRDLRAYELQHGIFAEVILRGDDGRMLGLISRANVPAVRGDKSVARGCVIEFTEAEVWAHQAK